MTTKHLVTANNNLLCGLDIETTGLQSGFHEIIQIGILPLDTNLEPRKDLPPFDQKMKPLHLERINLDALKINKNRFADIIETGFEPDVVESLFYSWFEKLKLGTDRKIIPVGHNIARHDLPFIQHWLGYEAYNTYFHGHVRDTMTICCYLNDRAEFHAEQTPFPKLSATEMAKKLEIERYDDLEHDALFDAYIGSQCYRKLLIKFIDHI